MECLVDRAALYWTVLLLFVGACNPEDRTPSFTPNTLPVIVVDTHGVSVPDEPKQPASLTLYADGLLQLSDLQTRTHDFTSMVGIEKRGHSSQALPKKQYGIELWDHAHADVEQALLGMPADSDWVLSAPYMDKSLLRNHFAYGLERSLGRYAPRTVFVELYLNDDGADTTRSSHYRGIYVLTERIKRGADRVRVEKQSGDQAELAGGYILQITMCNRVTSRDRWFGGPDGTAVLVEYPKPDALSEAQLAWISEYVGDFDEALRQKGDAYLDYIELGSFIDYILLSELMRNHDVFANSTFLSKARAGKLYLGPLWDLDRALGDAKFDDNWTTEGFLMPQRGWGPQLFQKESFVTAYRARWRELRRDLLRTEAMHAQIDAAVDELGDAVDRNFARWDVLGRYVPANQAPYAKSHPEEVAKIKAWLAARATWLDEHIDDLCAEGGATSPPKIGVGHEQPAVSSSATASSACSR